MACQALGVCGLCGGGTRASSPGLCGILTTEAGRDWRRARRMLRIGRQAMLSEEPSSRLSSTCRCRPGNIRNQGPKSLFMALG